MTFMIYRSIDICPAGQISFSFSATGLFYGPNRPDVAMLGGHRQNCLVVSFPKRRSLP